MEKSKANKANKAKKEMIKNIIALIIFAIVACLAAAVLVPYGQMQPAPISEGAKETCNQKLELVKAAAPGSTVAFTCDELSALWYGRFTFGDIEGKTFEPSMISFSSAENGEMQVLMVCRVLTSFDVSLIINCVPSKADGGDAPYKFDVSYAKMGHVPFFIMQDFVAKQFEPALSPEEIKDAFTKAESVTWEDGQLTFKF